MKLAEALQIRKELVEKINQLGERLYKNGVVQEGEKPAEDPIYLLGELDKAIESYREYVYRINLTNSRTETKKGSLSSLLAKRDALERKRVIYSQFSESASSIVPRYSNSEIKQRPSVDVSKLQKDIDLISKEIREIDLLIQETNWLTELI